MRRYRNLASGLVALGFTCLTITGCYRTQEAEEARQQEAALRATPIIESDSELHAAAAEARQTAEKLTYALRYRQTTASGFLAKRLVIEGKTREKVWLTNLRYDGRQLHGEVWQKPQLLKKVKQGDNLSLSPYELYDWVYIEDGKLQGGYTIRVLYQRANAQGKKLLEKQFGAKIELS